MPKSKMKRTQEIMEEIRHDNYLRQELVRLLIQSINTNYRLKESLYNVVAEKMNNELRRHGLR